MISVVVLGAGHVGTHLCRAIHHAENLRLIQWQYPKSGITKVLKMIDKKVN